MPVKRTAGGRPERRARIVSPAGIIRCRCKAVDERCGPRSIRQKSRGTPATECVTTRSRLPASADSVRAAEENIGVFEGQCVVVRFDRIQKQLRAGERGPAATKQGRSFESDGPSIVDGPGLDPHRIADFGETLHDDAAAIRKRFLPSN